MSRVLVTGGTGFVAGHAIVELIKAGYDVHTRVRDLKRGNDVLAMLQFAGVDRTDKVQFFAADLLKDDGWSEAVRNCDYVFHIASPFPASDNVLEDEVIRPARDGAIRVLRAARDAGVKRVVMTSSFAAIGYGHPELDRTFTEDDWTNTNAKIAPYIKSKAISERAAWDFIKSEGGKLELTVINPTGIFGPVLSPDMSSSIEIVRSILNGDMPASPKIYFGIVDVRDVVDLHLTAMTHPLASGQRFIASSDEIYSLMDVAKILKKGMGPLANKAPRFEMPSLLVRFLARVMPRLKSVGTELDKKRRASNKKTKRVLNWTPRSSEEAVLASAKSLETLGLLS